MVSLNSTSIIQVCNFVLCLIIITGVGDWAAICFCLRKLDSGQCKQLGTLLGLNIFKLEKMTTLPDDMVKSWLRKEDKVKEKCGDPLTWEALVNALRKIGLNGIAHDIQRDKCGPTESGTLLQYVHVH